MKLEFGKSYRTRDGKKVIKASVPTLRNCVTALAYRVMYAKFSNLGG